MLMTLPNDMVLSLTNYLDNNSLRKLCLVNKEINKIFQPILNERKVKLFKVYICQRLLISNKDLKQYDESYFNLAASSLTKPSAVIFKTLAKAASYQFKQGTIWGVYAVGIPFEFLAVSQNKDILEIRSSYRINPAHIESLYFHKLCTGAKPVKNSKCNLLSPELSANEENRMPSSQAKSQINSIESINLFSRPKSLHKNLTVKDNSSRGSNYKRCLIM